MVNDPSQSSPEKGAPLHGELREILIESFEARGFELEFHPDHVCATKNGKTEIIPNKVVMQYANAFRRPRE